MHVNEESEPEMERAQIASVAAAPPTAQFAPEESQREKLRAAARFSRSKNMERADHEPVRGPLQ